VDKIPIDLVSAEDVFGIFGSCKTQKVVVSTVCEVRGCYPIDHQVHAANEREDKEACKNDEVRETRGEKGAETTSETVFPTAYDANLVCTGLLNYLYPPFVSGAEALQVQIRYRRPFPCR
jgi:hypothetical protein